MAGLAAAMARSPRVVSTNQGAGNGLGGGRRLGVATKPFRYKPYVQPTSPPPGTYDPGLDAQAQSAQRGLGDLTSDTAMQQSRANSDYALGGGRIFKNWANQQADLLKASGRASENRIATLGNLQYQGDLQAQKQQGAMAAQGVDQGGGTGLASALARAASQARSRAPIETNYARTQADLATRMQRGQDAAQQQEGQLAIGYQRGTDDRNLALARAQRENTFYQQDVNTAKTFQAGQSGLYVPPVRPGNEHVGTLAGGRKIVFRVGKLGHAHVYVSPDGVVRAGPPGTSGWGVQLDPKSGKRVGAVKGSSYG